MKLTGTLKLETDGNGILEATFDSDRDAEEWDGSISLAAELLECRMDAMMLESS